MFLMANTVPRDSRFRGNDGLLALALLVFRVLAQDTYGSLASNDLAFNANLLYRGSDFHRFVLRYFLRYVILPRVRSYGDNSTVTLSPGSILMKCILIFPEMWARMR